MQLFYTYSSLAAITEKVVFSFVRVCLLISVQNKLIDVAGFKTDVRKPPTHSQSDESIFIDLQRYIGIAQNLQYDSSFSSLKVRYK